MLASPLTSEDDKFFTDTGCPIPPSGQRRFLEHNLDHCVIPKYKKDKANFWYMVKVIEYDRFVGQADQNHRDHNLSAINRREMEAAWYQTLLAKYLLFDARMLKSQKSDVEKLKMKQDLFRTAMDQRRTSQMEQYWVQKALENPGLDFEHAPDDDVTDHLFGYVNTAREMFESGENPWEYSIFQDLDAWELDLVKREYAEQYG